MTQKWIKTPYPGVRYREHPSRKSGRGLDRYFSIRYRDGKRQVEEGVGWASESVDAEYAARVRGEVRHNIRTGEGPQSLAEKRAILEREGRKEQERLIKARQQEYTFGDAAEVYLQENEGNASIKDDRLRLERHLKKPLAGLRLGDIRTQDIRDLRKRLEKTRAHKGDGVLSPQSVHHCLSLVRKIFNFAREVELPGSEEPLFSGVNPVKGKLLPRLDNTRWRILSEEEVAIVLEALDRPHEATGIKSQAQADKLRLISAISLETGARMGEIITLKKEHVLPGSGLIRLMDTKHGSRSVYPEMVSLEKLQQLRDEAPGAFVFAGRNKNPHLSRHHVTKAFSKVVNVIGLNDGVSDRRGRVTFHTLRHTYGTRQIMAGMDVYTLSRLMGHAHLSTTERYLHLAGDFKAQQAARIRGQS